MQYERENWGLMRMHARIEMIFPVKRYGVLRRATYCSRRDRDDDVSTPLFVTLVCSCDKPVREQAAIIVS